MVLRILSIQRCPFSSAFKASTRAHLNLSTRTVLYRQVTTYWMTEIHSITFRSLYSKSENCHFRELCSRLKSQLSEGGWTTTKIPQEKQPGTICQENLAKSTAGSDTGNDFKIFLLGDVNWKIKIRGKPPNSTQVIIYFISLWLQHG